MSKIGDRLRILGETTAEDFPVVTIERWCLEAANEIERLEEQVACLTARVLLLTEKVSK